MRGKSSGGMPLPVSATQSTTHVPSGGSTFNWPGVGALRADGLPVGDLDVGHGDVAALLEELRTGSLNIVRENAAIKIYNIA